MRTLAWKAAAGLETGQSRTGRAGQAGQGRLDRKRKVETSSRETGD